jgi:hypothetical protein
MEKFKVTEGISGRKKLIINSLYAKECCAFAIANNIKSVTLYPGYYTHPDLNPILPLKDFLEGLILNDKVDFSELCQFKKLTFLGALDNKKNVLDLACFPDLETLACNITERLKGLEACKKLKSLTVSYYNPESENLAELPGLASLEDLNIFKTRIKTLRGIEVFKNLKRLELYGAPRLETIESLGPLSNNLEEISFGTCKRVKDYETLGKVRSLKKILFTNSGEIKTLSFVKQLPDLEFISFVGTNVVDGDLSYCEGIGYVGFDDKRHYSHKMDDFKRR